MTELILTFENDGKTVHKQTKGFKGSDCVSKTKFIEEALGVMVGERKKTSEYYETEHGESERLHNRS
jgi:predicted SpoU family rRNA methylase